MEVLEDASTLEQMLLEQARRQRLPINGSMELTPLCNMNCDMCYVRLSRAEMERQGRLRSGAEWLALGREMRQAGVLFLLLTGGEPLTHPEFQEIYLGLQELGMILTINTNGTLIDREWAAFFCRHKPRRINITLYGADDGAYRQLCHCPGGFDRTLEAIRLLREKDVDVKLGCSLTKANCGDWERVIAIGESLGVPVRADTYMCPATRERERPFAEQSRLEPEQAARLRVQVLRREMGGETFRRSAAYTLEKARHGPQDRQVRGTRCMAGNCSFTVNWQGMLRACVIAAEPQEDVFARGFQAAWEQVAAETAEIPTSPVCAACPLREVCNTCPQYALAECGRTDGVPEYLCRYTRETQRELERVQQEWTEAE